jgi:hypothetical protein
VEQNINVNFQNFGLTFITDADDETRVSFAITVNQLASFDLDFDIDGVQNNYTLGQYWADRFAGDNVDFISNDAFAAWEAFILVSDSNNNIVEDGFAYGTDDGNGNFSATSNLRYSFNQNGSFDETNIAIAVDKQGKFYYGFSLGFPTLSFRREEFITEANLTPQDPPYSANSYTYRRLNDINGTGFNLKLGLIYRPIPELRIAASYQSNSWYTVNQFYEVDVTGSFNQSPSAGVGTATASPIIETGLYSYRLRTPAVYRLGLASVIGKFLILSVDYQYQDQENNLLYTNRNSFNIDESALIDDFQPGIGDLYRGGRQTISMGMEVRLQKLFLRGGYRLDESVYKTTVVDATASDITSLSAGIGWKKGPWSFDITYVNSQQNRSYAVYRGLDSSDEAFEVIDDLNMVNQSHNIISGVSLKF